MKKTTIRFGWWFLLVVVLIYLITYILKPDFLIPSLKFFLSIIKKIIPVFVLVFTIMFIINYFITPKKLVSYLKKENNKIKKWFITIIAGIISTGPIYMWYPLLADLKEHGISNGLIATFLYARAIKPALMPLMILYFGLAFTIVLTIAIIMFSLIQGITLEKLMEVRT